MLGFGLAYALTTWAKPYLWFTIHTLLLFIWISVALYLLGRFTAKSSNRQLFSGIVTGSVLLKMVLSLVFLWAYRHYAGLFGSVYVLIFLLVYGAFTAFEVYFMTLLGAGPFQLDPKKYTNEAPR